MRKLIYFLFICLTSSRFYSQQDISVGFARTTLEQNAVAFAVNYAKELEPSLMLFKTGKSSLYSFSPELKILLGSNDAFNGVTAKYVGNMMFFKKITIDGIPDVPDLSRMYHNFPIALGLESNRNFSFVNGIAEAGYIPKAKLTSKLKSILKGKIGIFLQGGYKYAFTDSTTETGGAVDESKEKSKDNIFRAKLVSGFAPKILFKKGKSAGISLIGNATFWYDFLNSEIYYKLEGKLRLIITADYFFDLGYEKGSGAPNFNQGEQFTTNLGIRF